MSEKGRLCFQHTGYNARDKTKIIGKFIKWDVLCWEAQNYSNETVGVVTKPAALVELEDGSVGLWSYKEIQFDTETKTLLDDGREIKTPEEMAQVYIKNLAIYESEYPLARSCFIAGYKAAQEHAHAALEEAEAKMQELRDQLMEESGGRLKLFKDDADAKAAYQEALEEIDLDKAWQEGYKAAQDQLADADKVMPDTCEHILDMSKMMDVNSSNNSKSWISVKDRLPELRQKVLVWYNNGYEVAYLQKFEPPKLLYPQFNNVEMFEWCFGDFEDFDVTHWMPLPLSPEVKNED